MIKPKKCPTCQSKRFRGFDGKFVCQICGDVYKTEERRKKDEFYNSMD